MYWNATNSITKLSLQGKFVANTSRESVLRILAGGGPLVFGSS